MTTTKLLSILTSVLVATAAQAAELRVDITGTAFTNTNPSLRPFEASFAFDSSQVSYGACSSQYVTSHVLLSNINVLLNGQLAFTAPSLAAGVGNTGACSNFYLAIDFHSAGKNFFWSSDPPAPPNGADPIANAFLGLHTPGNGAWLTTAENLNLAFDRITVTSVPEPGTLALMALGLGGLLLARLLKPD